MEDFSSFIHEELFLIDTPSTTKPVVMVDEEVKSETIPEEPSKHQLGVHTRGASDEDKQLLNKILSAISVDPKSILFAEEIDYTIGTWLVFADSLDFIEKGLQHFTISNVKASTIISSLPLPELRESVESKGRLWGLLKEHFNS